MKEVIQPSTNRRSLPTHPGVQFVWALLWAIVLSMGVASTVSAQTPVKVNFESRRLSIPGQANATTWQSVTFTRNFNGLIPVVIMGPAYSADGQPHTIRVRSVTATGFQWQIDEWDYGALTGAHPGNITVHFFAITEGTHVFGSQRWQVGKIAAVNRANFVQSLTGFTTAPNVLTQVYTTNNIIATNNPRALKSRNSAVTASGFTVNLETQENYTTAISNESVGYVAVSEGIGYLDGKALWAYSPGTVGHTVKTFYMGPFTNPVILAQSQTKADTDTGDLRLSTIPALVNGSTRVQMSFQEEASANANVTHTAEVVAGIFIGDMPGEAAAKLVYANASITQAGPGNWSKVNLTSAYTSPIVVFGPLTRADGTAAHIRVRNVLAVDPTNVNRASFEYQVDEWDFQDGIHGAETVSYMVMEEGVFAIGGQVVQAGGIVGVTETGTTQYVSESHWAADIYYEREPAIFAQCVTDSEADAAVARVDAIDTLFDFPMNFRVRLTEAENADQAHTAETVHYIVVPGGTGQFMSSNTNFRFAAGVSNTLNSTASTLTFPAKYAQPSFFAAVQGDLMASLANDGYYQTSEAADLDPVVIRQTSLNSAGVNLVQGAADADGDGVTDTIEAQMGTNPNLATSPSNASSGTASDWDTLQSLYSLTATVVTATGYERVDKTATTPVISPATISLARSYGTMQLTLKVTPENGTTDITKANAIASDYNIAGVSGGNLVIAANQATTGSPLIVNVNPVQDALLEVPENLKVSFGPVPSGANPQIVNVPTFVKISDAVETNPNNRTLYVAYLARGPGVISNGSGVAVALLEGNNDNAKVSVNVSGLSSTQNTTYLRINNDQDIRNNLGPSPPAAPNPLMDIVWNIRAAASQTTDQSMLNALDAGQIYVDINTVNYTSGEILGYFNRTTGSSVFDPLRPDLVAPALPGSLTAVAAERDIYRFMDQCTFGATTALYNEIKAEIELVDGTISDGCTSTGLITGYTNWLNKQMNLSLTPSPNFLTLVMAADNEEFVMRGTKPLYAGNDQQFAGNGFSATYDAFGNITNPYQVNSSNIASSNTPNPFGGAALNRRREWWTMVLQCKDQVRQRMAAALHEIVVISENDATVASRHYGAAKYWDMLAEGAFGKYRDILEKVTYSPMMGIYLSHLRNRAQYTSGGVDIFPDENYAREIMQLFTIGLVLRHPDGSLVLTTGGLPIPTYDQTDITELARVLTGLCHGARHANVTVTRNSTQGYNNVITTAAAGQIEFQGVNFTDFSSGAGEAFYQAPWIYPMKGLGRFNGVTYHDFGAKTLLHLYSSPTTVPAQTITNLTDLQTHPLVDTDIRLAHNALAGDPNAGSYNGHQNTPVFITRQLIQRLVTSNPSAGYIYRASQVYRSTNGNLGEVMKAILLDYEARSLTVADTLVSAGKLKEPLIQHASFLRALKPSSGAAITNLSNMSLPFSGVDSPMLTPYPAGELAKFPVGTTRLRFNDQTSVLGQSPQKAPSVFNWFLPDYIQPGLMASAGVYGPELQINTESMLVNRVNRHWSISLMNLTGGFPGFDLDDFTTNSASMAPQLLTSGPGSASPTSGVTTLIFDATNWNIPQTVTIYGLENQLADGLRNTSIQHTVSSSAPEYANTYSAPINFSVNDNEAIAGKIVAVTQTGGSTAVTEATVTDTYKVVLTASPGAGKTVTVTPSAVQPWQVASAVASTDITFSPTVLTFTDANWNTAQTVTVTAVDDAVVNSFLAANAPLNVRVATIRHAITSTDADYHGTQVSEFNCAITDNDTANRRFAPNKFTATGIPVVTEGSTTDNYVLDFATGTAPTASVTVTLNYDSTRVNLAGPNDANTVFTTVSPGVATLTTTAAGYANDRTITITAVDDATRQGVQFSTITHSTSSTDTAYNGLTCAPVRVRVNDNDNAAINGISIIETWGSTTAVENGMTDTYLVVLNKAPTGNVGLTWTGNDGDVAGIGNLTFTTANWWIPQTITVSGRNDLRVETTHISPVKYTASGGGYATTDVAFVNAIIGDDDLNSTAGITVTQSGGTTAAIEAGATDTLDVKLNGAPSNDVIITATANSQLSLAPAVLTFTPQNWNTVQTVTVTAADDAATEGAHASVIALAVSSTDLRYHTFVVPDVSVAITDNDNGGRIVLAATGVSTEVTEGGANDTVNVSLSGPAAPAANVVVNLASTAGATVTPATLTFTTANWNVAQPVTIQAVNDATSEVHTVETITATTNASQPVGFASLTSTTTATVYDNDEQNNGGAISIVQTNGATRVIEGGQTDTVEVVLRRAPTADVTLTSSFSVANIASVTPANLTFTAADWFIPQTVTVSAVDDVTADGAQSVNLIYTASATGGYILADTATQAVAVGDNEASNPLVAISATSGAVTEGGATFAYTVTLGAVPLTGATVRVTPTAFLLNAANSTQLSFSPTSVDFTTATWSTPQTITVTAANDTAAEAVLAMTVVNTTSIIAGTDARYNGMVAADVALTVNDNDNTVGRIAIAHTGGSTVLTEDAGTETVDVSLVGPAPATDVTVNLSRASGQLRFVVNGVAVDTATLTFTPGNYTVPQSVPLVVIADTGSEGVHADTLNATTAATAPANYTSLASSLPVRILDSDDLARSLIFVAHTGGTTRIAEGGLTDTYTVALRRAPTANVTLTGNYNHTQVSISPANLTFTPANWSTPQIVTVTAVDDFEVENAHTAAVTYIASHTGGYLPTDVATLTPISIADNEVLGTARITATESGGYTWLAENNQTSDTYTLVLGFQPSANVTLTPFASNSVGGANLVTFTPSTVTFTTANWNTPQTITVNLTANTANNGRRAAFIGHTVTTTDVNYKSYPAPGVNAIISDANETAGEVYVVPTGAGTIVNESAPGNSDTVYVFLRKPPTAASTVTVTPSLNAPTTPFAPIAGQVTFSPATLSFTPANWNIPQILTITSVNDAVVEPPLAAALICTPSATGGYVATNTNTTNPIFAVTVNDNDATGQLVITQGNTTVQEGGSTTYTVRLSGPPTGTPPNDRVTVTVITEKHAVPTSSHAIQFGYFANAATGSNLQKDRMNFDWSELTTIYTNAYHADRLGAPETTATAPNGHLAGTKAVIDKLDLFWGGGQMKAKWPDGSSATDNPRLVLIEGIQNTYSLTRLSTDTVNFPAEVLNRCRFAAHHVSIAPAAIVSH
jgi:hypothetical protein